MEIARYVCYASQYLVSLFVCVMKLAQTSLFINNDCVWCLYKYCIVVKIIVACCKRVQIDCVFNKYVLSMYLNKKHANVSF